jgi:hypothetical protein
MLGMKRSIAVVAAVAVCVAASAGAGCKRKTDTTTTSSSSGGSGVSSAAPVDKLATLRASVKTKLAKIAAIAPKAKTEAPAKPGAKPLTLKEGDYFTSQPELLVDPTISLARDDGGAPEFEETTMSLCSYATNGKLPPKDEDEKYLQECDKWTHAAIVRQTKWVAPVVHLKDKSFDPGVFEGDLLVYKIDTGELVASFPLSAKSSSEVEDDIDKGASQAEKQTEWQNMMIADLEVNIDHLIDKDMQNKTEE